MMVLVLVKDLVIHYVEMVKVSCHNKTVYITEIKTYVISEKNEIFEKIKVSVNERV